MRTTGNASRTTEQEAAERVVDSVLARYSDAERRQWEEMQGLCRRGARTKGDRRRFRKLQRRLARIFRKHFNALKKETEAGHGEESTHRISGAQPDG